MQDLRFRGLRNVLKLALKLRVKIGRSTETSNKEDFLLNQYQSDWSVGVRTSIFASLVPATYLWRFAMLFFNGFPIFRDNLPNARVGLREELSGGVSVIVKQSQQENTIR